MPIPGLTYSGATTSGATNSTVTSPSSDSNSQTPQPIPNATNNTPSKPPIIDLSSNKDTITVKKSEWLALLAIKRSWEEASPPVKKLKKKKPSRNVKTLSSPPKVDKSTFRCDEKDEQLKIHPSDSISEMEDDIEDSDPNHISRDHFKSKFFKKA
ncbi:unnamed protein product [Larinioides sclopetarius]|uniref:Uncharacterized protein n=1 Tax=Larinioides sclopetarius TaxID=280406 RepID=A0AAV2BGS8_9ARAC